MSILGWILFGLIIGALAKLVMPGRDPGGIIITMLLGIAGAVIGGFIGRGFGFRIDPAAARAGGHRFQPAVATVSRSGSPAP